MRLSSLQYAALARLIRADKPLPPAAIGSRRTVGSLRGRGLLAPCIGGESDGDLVISELGERALPLLAVEEALRNLVDDERGMETVSGILIQIGRSPRRTDDSHAVRAALEVLEAEGKVKGYSVKRSRFWRSGREADAPRGVLDPAVPVRDAYWVDYVEPRAVVA